MKRMRIFKKEVGVLFKAVSHLGRDSQYYFESREDFEEVFSHILRSKDLKNLVTIIGYTSVTLEDLMVKKQYVHEIDYEVKPINYRPIYYLA